MHPCRGSHPCWSGAGGVLHLSDQFLDDILQKEHAGGVPCRIDTFATWAPVRRMTARASSSSPPLKVMPSWALESCVEVIFRTLMVGPRRFSPRAARASRSLRSKLTSANSEATNKPVPTVRTKPMPIMITSYSGAPLSGGCRNQSGKCEGGVIHSMNNYMAATHPVLVFLRRGKLYVSCESSGAEAGAGGTLCR